MSRTKDALARLARPALLAQSRVSVSLNWLEQPSLPASLRAHHVRVIEEALQHLLTPQAWREVQGSGEAARYRAAFQALLQTRSGD